MSVNVSIDIPDEMYQRLEQRAEQTRRSVEEETVDVLAGAMTASDSLADEFAQELLGLEQHSDSELSQLLQSRLPDDLVAELHGLHSKRQREGLTSAETNRCRDLVCQDERNLLRRAKAAAVLKSRGVDVNQVVRP